MIPQGIKRSRILLIVKMKYKTVKSTATLQILEDNSIQSLPLESDKLRNILKYESITSQRLAKRAQLTTGWIMQGGLTVDQK